MLAYNEGLQRAAGQVLSESRSPPCRSAKHNAESGSAKSQKDSLGIRDKRLNVRSMSPQECDNGPRRNIP